MGVVETHYIPTGRGRYPIYFANGGKVAIEVPQDMGITSVKIEYTPKESLCARLRKRYKRP